MPSSSTISSALLSGSAAAIALDTGVLSCASALTMNVAAGCIPKSNVPSAPVTSCASSSPVFSSCGGSVIDDPSLTIAPASGSPRNSTLPATRRCFTPGCTNHGAAASGALGATLACAVAPPALFVATAGAFFVGASVSRLRHHHTEPTTIASTTTPIPIFFIAISPAPAASRLELPDGAAAIGTSAANPPRLRYRSFKRARSWSRLV